MGPIRLGLLKSSSGVRRGFSVFKETPRDKELLRTFENSDHWLHKVSFPGVTSVGLTVLRDTTRGAGGK